MSAKGQRPAIVGLRVCKPKMLSQGPEAMYVWIADCSATETIAKQGGLHAFSQGARRALRHVQSFASAFR
eukprot:11211603-Lingulodinium_polyedra.AAC.1